jgi:hypothetical protein
VEIIVQKFGPLLQFSKKLLKLAQSGHPVSETTFRATICLSGLGFATFVAFKEPISGVEFDPYNKKTIVLFERHCHATEKSEAIACARSCRSPWVTRWWTLKRIIEKNGGPRRRRGTRDL